MEAVLTYLRVVDPDGARCAQARYSCFDHFGGDPQAYGYAASLGLAASYFSTCLPQQFDAVFYYDVTRV